jgi:PilZ domain-containing protein
MTTQTYRRVMSTAHTAELDQLLSQQSPSSDEPSASRTDAAPSPGGSDPPSHPLSPASAPAPVRRREHLRFDKVFAVRVESMLFGDMNCVARNISAGGMFLELADPLPLGATLRVCFPVPDGSGEIVALGEVKNHYFINYMKDGANRSVTGMAVRFTEFEADSHRVLADCLTRMRVLH